MRGRRTESGGAVFSALRYASSESRYFPSENRRSPSWSWISDACDGGVVSARRMNEAAATRADAAATRMALRMNPPALQESDRYRIRSDRDCPRIRVFREVKNISARVLLDWHAVVHLIDPQNLGVAAVA